MKNGGKNKELKNKTVKTVDGLAELYWQCPYKTCLTDNCTSPKDKVQQCCHCKRKVKVNY